MDELAQSVSIASSEKLWSRDERDQLMHSHPILERDYLIPTPMMKRAYEVISERVWARRTGAVFYASPRTGKTRCAIAAKDFLEQEFDKIHVTLLSARPSLRPSDTHMFRSILDAEAHVLSGRARAEVLFDNLVGDIEIKTKEKGGRQYVLMIDEMHVLSDYDLRHLVSLHNALEFKKIRMTTISFAQPEILHRRSALMASNDRQIIARFLSEPLYFRGCSGASDLRELLLAYDVSSEYPEGSGWSYTKFFAPIAYENGFKLSNFTDQIWRGLVTAAGVGDFGPIPMEHTCQTIESLLLGLRDQDCISLILDHAEIEAAVASSLLSGFNALMTNQS